jgi:hypothetical protein
MKITVVLITYNEADRLEAALKSVEGVADEIVTMPIRKTTPTPRPPSPGSSLWMPTNGSPRG